VVALNIATIPRRRGRAAFPAADIIGDGGAKSMKTASVLLAACVAAGLSGSAFANDLKADTNFRDTIVGFNLKESYGGVSLSISGPHHFHASAHAQGAAPTIDLRQYGRPEDDLYQYQLNAATNEAVRSNTKHDNGRGDHCIRLA
jgi:hypothetical protein